MELFQPNNLSRARPEFVTLSDTALRAEVQDLLLTSYGVSESQDISIAAFDGPNISSQNLKLTTRSDTWFLKARAIARRNEMVAEVGLSEILARLGQRVPRVIHSTSGELTSTQNEKCWVLYKFQEGDYFSGTSEELGAAARSFSQLTLAASTLPDVADDSNDELFCDDLNDLLQLSSRSSDPLIVEVCSTHRNKILETLNQTREQHSLITRTRLPLHLDYHPLNILMKDGEVVCILDLEHLKFYPVVAGLGFAAFKLIRQAMVNKEFRAKELSSPSAVTVWIDDWHKTFPDNQFTVTQLGNGARFRILKLIHMILDASLKQGDQRSNYDLAKQINSLYEADVIFRP